MFNYGLIPFAKVQLTYEKSSVEEKNKNKKIKSIVYQFSQRKNFAWSQTGCSSSIPVYLDKVIMCVTVQKISLSDISGQRNPNIGLNSSALLFPSDHTKPFIKPFHVTGTDLKLL